MKIEASYTWSTGGASNIVTVCVDSSLPESAEETEKFIACILRALLRVNKRKVAGMSDLQKQVRQ